MEENLVNFLAVGVLQVSVSVNTEGQQATSTAASKLDERALAAQLQSYMENNTNQVYLTTIPLDVFKNLIS